MVDLFLKANGGSVCQKKLRVSRKAAVQECPEPNLAFTHDIDCELQSSVLAFPNGEETRNFS